MDVHQDPVTPTGDVLVAERSRLIGLAYRITGSRTDAEDAVQDAWLRWQAAEARGEAPTRPAAWLTTTVSRLALDRLRSAQVRRESYVGPWLPEPVLTGPQPGMSAGTHAQAGDPGDLAELAESLRFGFLVMLDRLKPVERVVLLLADVFAVPFDEIATVVDRSPAACRQVAVRARERVRSEPPAPAVPSAATWKVVTEFVELLQRGDVDRLLELVADDVVMVSDGGPTVHAARRPVVGPQRVVRLLSFLARKMADVEGVTVEMSVCNGDPAVLVRFVGVVISVFVFEADDRQVRRVHTVVNPQKLAMLGAGLG